MCVCSDCERLARACLAIGKESDDPFLENGGEKVFDLISVNIVRILSVRVSVVEGEVVVLDELGDAVHFVLWLVDRDARISASNRVDLACLHLLGKERSFPDTDANVHLRTTQVLQCLFHVGALLLNHHVEVYVDVAS